ncbi:hypothetical protein GLAREA_10575 [Glarea lozoyensis ATCC 20868]|uniref:MT-A70-domain-containing protein n=1 Tax=Glarea lozoyensis (strain ATCC 20868 / MF5171) TaxID=1116229 RepID=S3DAY4_GLAL2|nr:uncharacterized protein GLAREA_10575 [Glarea lozoyensis ATCC 20868]EPE34880.1 hypothetical protein GLAREA_10575 [Glarea lozoyensis ATCC 20868]
MEPCILYQDEEASVILLDIPRSIELAQGHHKYRIVSSEPLRSPFPSVEPKSAKAKANLKEVPIEDLVLQKHLQLALNSVAENYSCEWSLPRTTKDPQNTDVEIGNGKRKRVDEGLTVANSGILEKSTFKWDQKECTSLEREFPCLSQNATQSSIFIKPMPTELLVRMPPYSSALEGDIAQTITTFSSTAPKFDLIVLDPPWPNRSARRKQAYGITYSTSEINQLLSSIPIEDHMVDNGLVAVWVTNKVAFQELILGEGGLFDHWGIELNEKWVWLKVTTAGEPICPLDSVWRKPYEILLVGRKRVQEASTPQIKTKVVIGVPDMHSRKPNLKHLFAAMEDKPNILGLEIFARNLTAGWWAWGNEVFKFQAEEHWKDDY